MSNETPDKFGQGGQRRQYFQIRELAQAGNRVHVVTLNGPQSDRSIRELATVERFTPFLRGRPIPFRRWRARTLAVSGRWDRAVVSHVESWSMVAGVELTEHPPILLDVHNVFSPWFRSLGGHEEADRFARLEARAVAGASAISVCSAAERDRLIGAHPKTADKAIVAPLGIAADEWAGQTWSRGEPVVALFGSWSWKPNADGLAWFVENVWPRVILALPGACAIVAGSGADLPRGGWPQGIRVIGRVDDLPAFLATATVVATPVKNGVGASIKFGEALASGGSVVATADAASAHPGAPAFVSDDPTEWASWIVERLDRRHFEPAPAVSREYAIRELSWRNAVDPLIAWLNTGGRNTP